MCCTTDSDESASVGGVAVFLFCPSVSHCFLPLGVLSSCLGVTGISDQLESASFSCLLTLFCCVEVMVGGLMSVENFDGLLVSE